MIDIPAQSYEYLMPSSPLSLAAVALAGLVAFAAPGYAADNACGTTGNAPLPLDRLLQHKSGQIAHLWGKENLAFLPGESGAASGILRVSYPAGSFSPGQSPIRGGAGFEFHGTNVGTPAACLTYKVRFPAGFDFVKGGKLPGLFGGDDPRGCVANDTVTGFSARLMWRAGGAGELYLYAPDRDTRCGKSIGRGAWTFQPGTWVSVAEKAIMNTPGKNDGSIEIWIDGASVVKAEGLTLGTAPDASVSGVLFATFFGGGEASWATPRDQSLDFADLTLTEGHR